MDNELDISQAPGVNDRLAERRRSLLRRPLFWISFAAVGVLLLMLLSMLSLRVRQAGPAARRTQSKMNLKQMGLALHNYYDEFGMFPAGTVSIPELAVEQRFSWMLPLMRFTDQPVRNSVRPETGWQSAEHADVIRQPQVMFRNPEQRSAREFPSSGDYVAIAGLGVDAAELPDDHRRAGVFGYDRCSTLASITDGTSNTLMLATTVQPNRSMFAGGRETVRGFSQQPYLNGPDGIGAVAGTAMVQVLMADGSVLSLLPTADSGLIEALATKAAGEHVADRSEW